MNHLTSWALVALIVAVPGCGEGPSSSAPPVDADTPPADPPDPIRDNSARLFEEGRQTFRFDTFGSEAFWSDTLRLHEAIAGAPHGGVGAGVSPAVALQLGLKVDVDALPEDLVAALLAGQVDLEDPATTLALLELDAIVGVKGHVAGGQLEAVGIQCSLCHSTVDDSFAPGIGRRLDGWPNRDLDVGAIIASAPDLSAVAQLLGVDEETVRAVAQSWGPGKFDAALFLDGKAFRPDGKTAATLLPPAYGLAGVNLSTYTGWGNVTYWNAFVANLEMHGIGRFHDPRLDDPVRFPVAASAGFSELRPVDDQVTAKLAALQHYQLAIPAPRPPAGSFDADAATRGQAIFNGKADCARCHVPPLFTEPGWALHTADEIGIDDFQAQRSPTGRYRTTPLGGLWSRAKGGYYHDGRFADLAAVVEHYDATFATGLSPTEAADLLEYLKSL